jgi:hypothetical protein
MGRRDALISKSILRAIFDDSKDDNQPLLARILAFFALFQLVLSRYRDDLFRELRTEIWQVDEADYRESFRRRDKKARLKPVGDLGYSGSVRSNQHMSNHSLLTVRRHSSRRKTPSIYSSRCPALPSTASSKKISSSPTTST